MGYPENIQMELISKSKSRTYHVDGASLSWGKFYQNPDKDHELSTSDVNGTTFKYGSNAVVASCGREDAASGTEGTIDIYDGSTKVGTVYWDDPWAAGKNNVVGTDNVDEDYAIEVGKYATTGPEIGWVKITVSHAD